MSEFPAKPITPKEAVEIKRETYPKAVFEAFNLLLSQGKNGDKEIEILREYVVAQMILNGLNREDIYRKGWLNVVDLYEAAGWKVKTITSTEDDASIIAFCFTPNQ